MTKQNTSAQSRTTRTGRTLIGIAAITLCAPLYAEIENELDALVLSAWRMPGKISEATSAITVLDPRDFEERGILDLRQALNEVPGVAVALIVILVLVLFEALRQQGFKGEV